MGLALRLTAWENHEGFELRTNRPVTILAGPNASGKSAVLDALEFVFLGTGKLRGISTKRELAELSIRDDSADAFVDVRIPELDLELGRLMDRNAVQTVFIDGTAHKVARADAKIREKLGIEPERVRAALEAEHILVGDAAKRRWVFFKATGASATRGEIVEPLKEVGLNEIDAARVAKSVLEDGFAVGQKIAEAERVARTRAAQAASDAAPDPIFSPPWGAAEIDLAGISLEEFVKRETELEARISEADVATGQDRGRLAADLENARRIRETLICERDELTAKAAALENAPAAYEEALAAVETLDDGIQETRNKLSNHQAEENAIASGNFEKPDPCPAIPGRLVCPLTKAKLTAHAKTLEKRRLELERFVAHETDELGQLENRRRQANEGRNVARDDAVELERIRERLGELETEIPEAEGRLAETEEKLGIPDDAPATTENDAESLRERLGNLRQVLAAKRNYDSALASASTASETRRDAEEERATWDRAAKLLSPQGLPSRLFAARASELQAYVDELGIEPPIRLTPEAELEAKIGGRWRRRAQLSESWRNRLSVAASHALARAARFPILVVDRFDHLDRPGRANVLEGVRRVAPNYPGGVLILATAQRDDVQPTGLEDVETFAFRNGRLELVG